MAGKTNTLRRREVRRNIPRSRRPLRELLNRSQVVTGLLVAIGFVVVASMITMASRAEPSFRAGQIADRAEVARVEFETTDDAATERAREDERRRTPTIYDLNRTFFDRTQQRLASLPERVAAADSVAELDDELGERYALTEEALAALQQYVQDGQATDRWHELVGTLMDELESTGLLTPDDYADEMQRVGPSIRLRISEDRSSLRYEDELVDVGDEEELSATIQRAAGRFPEVLRPVIAAYFIDEAQPTYERNAHLTAEARDAAARQVDPVREIYPEGEVLVEAGQELDDAAVGLLREHYAALPYHGKMMTHMGVLGLILLLTVGLIGCVLSLRPRVAVNPMRGLTLAGLLLATLLLAWLGRGLGPHVDIAVAVGPAMLAAVILAIAYDQRFAIAVAVIHALLIGLALDLSIGAYMVAVAASIVAVAQLREVRDRGTLVRTGFVTGVVVAAGVWAAGLAEWTLVPGMLASLAAASAWAFAAAVFVGFFVLGVLPWIERTFRVTTAMTLLELCDVNQPLLRRLAQAAPGTYNHSLQVGTLAEAAAESIGANSLLVRVGAYYHDIGKIHKPQYFIENQLGGMNRHDKLSPAMSLLIIVGHVKDGIEMAREYGLPPSLHHFIESHHGTTLVEYFYHAAKKGKAEADQPGESEFRYPGPRPHSKESAILMLCDGVESATRSMAEPTSARIESLVHELTMKRLMDGQFGQCDLTLGELELIEQALTKSLCAIYHGRIAYPAGPATAQPPRLPRQDKERAAAG